MSEPLSALTIVSREIRGHRCYTFLINGRAFGDWGIYFASRESLCDCLEALWNG